MSSAGRAVETAEIIAELLKADKKPDIVKDWRLNERHYGDLTGSNKAQMAEKYGKDQVQVWRRSFDTRPPPMNDNHPYFDRIGTASNYAPAFNSMCNLRASQYFD